MNFETLILLTYEQHFLGRNQASIQGYSPLKMSSRLQLNQNYRRNQLPVSGMSHKRAMFGEVCLVRAMFGEERVNISVDGLSRVLVIFTVDQISVLVAVIP